MVAIEAIRVSNQQVASGLPAGLVAVFVGATSGIGESSMKQFARSANAPRIYFVGRTASWAERIKKELSELNPQGTYTFLQCDASQLKSVDKVSREIKEKEAAINVLFISIGTLLTGTKTDEGLHYFAALSYYSRIRFAANLLPLLQAAPGLRRVVTVFAGGKEGQIDTNDFPGWKLGALAQRGHFASLITLSFETLAKKAPEVSFVHDYPGFVKTDLARGSKGIGAVIVKGVAKVFGPFLNIPIEEAGERHAFYATSSRYQPASGDAKGVELVDKVHVGTGTDGKEGSGVYSVHSDGETKVQGVLAELRKKGVNEKVWEHVEGEFVRVTGSAAV
ncbi:uncharacterized protein BJX67DRAFT_75032 [Aspergillus lucknowensis]|uniref:Short-chain dehydrogenases/reductase n=1 Tax=Aspergillus lucknowensis TaxID=176173 RepID=A0ABR4LUH3_9EURO